MTINLTLSEKEMTIILVGLISQTFVLCWLRLNSSGKNTIIERENQSCKKHQR
jgi:hypothetical protein